MERIMNNLEDTRIKGISSTVLWEIGAHDLTGLEQLILIHRLVTTLDFPGISAQKIGIIETNLRDLIRESS